MDRLTALGILLIVICEAALCDKYDELDKRIEHFRRFVDPALDPVTLQRLRAAIAELEAEEMAINCERNGKR